MSNPVRKTSLVLLACTILGPAPTLAAPATHEQEVTLRADPAMSAEALYEMIRQRAASACRTHAIAPHFQARYERECRKEFVADAIRRFDRPALTAIHEARSSGKEEQARLAEKP